MKPKLLLYLALVLRLLTAGNVDAQQSPGGISFIGVLQEYGPKFGCHFTLEYQSFSVAGKASLVIMPVRTNLTADSIPSLVTGIRNYLDGFVVVQDSKNPKIIHIIDKTLANDTNYVLNKRISINYSGSLSSTNIPDPNKPGFDMAAGGLLSAVAEKAGRITGGSRDSTGMGMMGDRVTRVSVNATNETVRSILTDCLPENYSSVMWRATTAIMPSRDNKQWVLVQFFGPAIQNKPLKPQILEPWKSATIKFVVPGNSSSGLKSVTAQISVQRAVFTADKRVGAFSVLEIHDTSTKKFYIIDGEHTFYLLSQTGLKGFTLGPGVLLWSTNYIQLSDANSSDKAISLFEEQYDDQRVYQERQKRLDDRIELRPCLPRYWFSDRLAPGGLMVRPQVKAIDVTDGVLRLDIQNPSTSSSASIWIDPEGKKIKRSVVDGQEMDVNTGMPVAAPLKK